MDFVASKMPKIQIYLMFKPLHKDITKILLLNCRNWEVDVALEFTIMKKVKKTMRLNSKKYFYYFLRI